MIAKVWCHPLLAASPSKGTAWLLLVCIHLIFMVLLFSSVFQACASLYYHIKSFGASRIGLLNSTWELSYIHTPGCPTVSFHLFFIFELGCFPLTVLWDFLSNKKLKLYSEILWWSAAPARLRASPRQDLCSSHDLCYGEFSPAAARR